MSRSSAGDTLELNDIDVPVGSTLNEKNSSVAGSKSEESATKIPATNGARKDLPENNEHSPMGISSLPSVGPSNSVGGSMISNSYPQPGSMENNMLIASFQPNFLPHMNFQSLQSNPANPYGSFPPAWGVPFGGSTGNESGR